MTIERWHAKADSVARAWHAKFGAWPPRSGVALALAHAEHETQCGDVVGWEGEHNWGAIQLRVPSQNERAIIDAAGVLVPPTFAQISDRVALARAALADAVAAGKIPPPRGANGEGAALHVDSSPGKGFYWIFFRACQDDDEGAAVFVHVIAENRPSCRAILESGGTAAQYASALYSTRYFEGFRKPKSWYAIVAGRWAEVDAGTVGAISGAQLNVNDYAGALSRILPGVASALVDWQPPADVMLSAAAAERLSRLSADVTAGRANGLDALDRLMASAAASALPPDAVAEPEPDTDRNTVPESWGAGAADAAKGGGA